MTLDSYLNKVRKFDRTTKEEDKINHYVLGILEESGEVAGVFKRRYRGDYGDTEECLNSYEFRRDLMRELGDLMWYFVMLADEMKIATDAILWDNIEKLRTRERSNTILGEGDER